MRNLGNNGADGGGVMFPSSFEATFPARCAEVVRNRCNFPILGDGFASCPRFFDFALGWPLVFP